MTLGDLCGCAISCTFTTAQLLRQLRVDAALREHLLHLRHVEVWLVHVRAGAAVHLCLFGKLLRRPWAQILKAGS